VNSKDGYEEGGGDHWAAINWAPINDIEHLLLRPMTTGEK
jgi:hypothetical protein